MRAVICRRLGPVEDLAVGEFPDPEPGPGQVLVAVAAAGANFVDGLIVEGRYQMRPDVPYVPGGELAGTVVRLGPGVTEPVVGSRVLALTGFHAFAQLVVVPATATVRVPDVIDTEVAATFTQAYCTAHFSLLTRGAMTEGETVLVLGGGGAIGRAAVDLAVAFGGRAVATGSTEAKRAAAVQVGAAATIDPEGGGLKEAVRALTGGRGADLVVDPVGGALAEEALRALRDGGRYLVVGFTSGEIPRLPLNQVLLRNRAVLGCDWGAWSAEHHVEQRRLLDDLLAMAARGRLHPAVPERRTFEEAPGVLRALLDRRATGRVVLVP